MSRERFEELERRAHELWDLQKAQTLAVWDQRTVMPPGGATVRPHLIATVGSVVHQRWVDARLGELLEDLRDFEDTVGHDSYEASLIRLMRRERDKEKRVPQELREARSLLCGEAYTAWTEAQRTSDFRVFLPYLSKQWELARRYAECFDVDEPYDALLDDYDPGLTTADVRKVFARLREGLEPLIEEGSQREVDDSFLERNFPVPPQQELEQLVLSRFGFREGTWRLDPTVHPFALSPATTDIRMTTRYSPARLSLFTTMHEGGHGLYQHYIDPAFERTPLCAGASAAVHESQSRIFENVVGRRISFWRWCYPHLQRVLPEPFASVELEAFHTAINRIKPSPIRIDADEATYGMHIVMRFELEVDLMTGNIVPEDLPEIWNQRMGEFLGLDIPDDGSGVLQDGHWANGYLGYFPAYALGNIMAAQIWERMQGDNPHIDAQLEEGDMSVLTEWLREHIWRHGRRHTPATLLDRVVGTGLSAEPFLRYLHAKHGVAEAAPG